jgi:hypothetical protein
MTMYEAVDQLLSEAHSEVFKASRMRLMRDDGTVIEVDLPWPRKVRLVFADLLCGTPGTIKCSDEGQQEYLDELVRRLDLWQNVYECAGDTVAYGDGLLKLFVRDDAVGLRTQPPSYWFPVVAEDDVRDIKGHILAWRTNVGTAEQPRWIGTIEKHQPGSVTRGSFTLDSSGQKILSVTWDDPVPNRVPGFLLFHAPNWRTSRQLCGNSLFNDSDSLLSEIEVRMSQMSKVLDKHSDPGMYGGEGGVQENPQTGELEVKGGQFYVVGEGEQPPGYVVWNGQLLPNIEYIKMLREELYAALDVCPALFGKLEQGMAESGSALKRLLIAPLAATKRLRLTYDPVVKNVLATAAALEGETLSNLTIVWKDGLPEDPMEAAQVEQTRVAAGNTSIESSVKRLDGLDGVDLQQEMDRIKADKAAAKPALPTMPEVKLPEKV